MNMNFFRNEDYWYCGFTVAFTLLPFITNFIWKSFEACKDKEKTSNLKNCLYHLPGVQAFRLFHLLKKQFEAIDELQKKKDFQTRVKPIITNSTSLKEKGNLNLRKIKQIKSLRLPEHDFEELLRLIRKLLRVS